MADRPQARARPVPHPAAHWVGWAAGSMLLWLLLTSTFDWAEELVGAVASALAATAAQVVRNRGLVVFRPRLRWARHAVGLPARIATETVSVFVALARHVTGRRRVRGRYVAVPFRHGAADDPEAAARRALATAGMGVSPNTYAIGVDPDRDELLIHQLVPGEVAGPRRRRATGGRP